MKKDFGKVKRSPRLTGILALSAALSFTHAQEVEVEPDSAALEALREAIESGKLEGVDIGSVIPSLPQEKRALSSKGKADYGPAFQKLFDLGLPDTAGAKYVKLTFSLEQQRENSGYGYQRFSVKRLGNAWILPQDDPENPARSAIHQGHLIAKIIAKEKRNLIVRLFAGDDTKTRNNLRKAEWTEVDPNKEVEALVEQFDGDHLSRLFDQDLWSYDETAVISLGELLFTAGHMHRAGHPKAGNKLAREILTRAPYPFKVIDAAVNKLAEWEYRTLLNTLYLEQDWRKFLGGARRLSTKYPRGWSQQPGLKILIPQVVTFLSKGPAPIQSYKDLPLDTEIIDLLTKDLVPKKAGNSLFLSMPSCWLIDSKSDSYDHESNESFTPIETREIIRKGIAALPTLISISTDTTLLPASFINYTDSYSRYSSYNDFGSISGNNSSPAQSIYKSMPRPCTRGEIVRAILIATLPSNEINWSSLSPEEFQLAAYDWWKSHQKKSAVELAKIYLQSDSSNQSSIAINVLLSSKDESSFRTIEEHILTSDSLLRQSEMAMRYLKIRKGKGRKFYQSYLAAIKEEVSQYGPESQDRYTEQIEKISGSLSILVEDISAETIIAEISSGKRELEAALPQIRVAVGTGNFHGYLEKFIPFITQLHSHPTGKVK